MRIQLPTFAKKTDLFAYLKANKDQLIAKKKSTPIIGEGIDMAPEYYVNNIQSVQVKGVSITKDDSLAEDVIRVKVVANACNFVDSHLDVCLTNSPKKSIKERKKIIPHLRDHIHQTTAEVGDVVDITLEDLDIKSLGYTKSQGTTQCVVFTTDIRKDYDLKTYLRYKNGKASQHSIGLQYVKIVLCINTDDEYYKEEKANFDKYYDSVINKEVIDQYGYFWAVLEYKLIENSVVLFGSNEYTPTLAVFTSDKSLVSTSEEPDEATQKRLEKLKQISETFKNINKNSNEKTMV
jgi:hypothetical protein